MKVKIGDTLDLVGYKGKRTPIQVVSISQIGDAHKEEIAVFTYLDNSGRPNGTCRVAELAERDQTIKKETVVAKTKTSENPKN